MVQIAPEWGKEAATSTSVRRLLPFVRAAAAFACSQVRAENR